MVRGGDTLLGYEAARVPGPCMGTGVCGWSSPMLFPRRRDGVGVGLFLENYIVDASIIVSNF